MIIVSSMLNYKLLFSTSLFTIVSSFACFFGICFSHFLGKGSNGRRWNFIKLWTSTQVLSIQELFSSIGLDFKGFMDFLSTFTFSYARQSCSFPESSLLKRNWYDMVSVVYLVRSSIECKRLNGFNRQQYNSHFIVLLSEQHPFLLYRPSFQLVLADSNYSRWQARG